MNTEQKITRHRATGAARMILAGIRKNRILSVDEARLLLLIGWLQTAPVKEIGTMDVVKAYTGITHGSIARYYVKFHDLRWIRDTKGPDRRYKPKELTDEGWRVVDEILEPIT